MLMDERLAAFAFYYVHDDRMWHVSHIKGTYVAARSRILYATLPTSRQPCSCHRMMDVAMFSCKMVQLKLPVVIMYYMAPKVY